MNRIQRFKDIIPDIDKYVFHILGCGAIGSSAAIQLARTGAEIFCLYDSDIVSIENVGVSQYSKKEIGMKKVEALSSILEGICDNPYVEKNHGKFKEIRKNNDKNIIILGFDNMASRLMAVESILNTVKPILVIDGRMGSETYIQHTFQKPTLSKYKKKWFKDSEGSTEPCTAKATSYCSNMAGSFITNTVGKALDKLYIDKSFLFHFPSMSLMKI